MAYVPLTIFYIVVLLFKINIPSSRLQGYVLFCQIFSSPIILRHLIIFLRSETGTVYYKGIEVFGTLYGISAILIIIFDPYKQQLKNYSNHLTIYLLLIASMFSVSSGLSYNKINATVIFYVISALIFLLNIFYILLFCWVIRHRALPLQFFVTSSFLGNINKHYISSTS